MTPRPETPWSHLHPGALPPDYGHDTDDTPEAVAALTDRIRRWWPNRPPNDRQ